MQSRRGTICSSVSDSKSQDSFERAQILLPAAMANADVVAFNIAAFVATLFLLEAGADKFIDHTAIVARRISVSQAVIGLLTAGAEWEEVSLNLSLIQA